MYLTSDLHFFHARILEYCSRPFSSVEEMNEHLIEQWNKYIQPSDIVYHLGDFAFTNYDNVVKILSRLNGEKYFILGNHDKKVLRKNKESLLSSKLIKEFYNHKIIEDGGHKFLFWHYYEGWKEKFPDIDYLIHGHSHGTQDFKIENGLDVGVDSKMITSEYRPLHIEEIFKYFNL